MVLTHHSFVPFTDAMNRPFPNGTNVPSSNGIDVPCPSNEWPSDKYEKQNQPSCLQHPGWFYYASCDFVRDRGDASLLGDELVSHRLSSGLSPVGGSQFCYTGAHMLPYSVRANHQPVSDLIIA